MRSVTSSLSPFLKLKSKWCASGALAGSDIDSHSLSENHFKIITPPPDREKTSFSVDTSVTLASELARKKKFSRTIDMGFFDDIRELSFASLSDSDVTFITPVLFCPVLGLDLTRAKVKASQFLPAVTPITDNGTAKDQVDKMIHAHPNAIDERLGRVPHLRRAQHALHKPVDDLQ